MPKKSTSEAAAKEWITLKASQKAVEKRLDQLKPVIEAALSAAPENVVEFHGWKFTLVEFEKDSFSLSKAREKIDGRVLAPYVTTSNVVQIRSSWQGGDEVAA